MTARFPRDASKQQVLKAFARPGFALVREGNHLALRGANPDGTAVSLTLPNHRTIKGSILRAACTQCGIRRGDFLRAYQGMPPTPTTQPPT